MAATRTAVLVALATLGASGAAGVGSALVLGIAVSTMSICGTGICAAAMGVVVLADRVRRWPGATVAQ